MFSSSGPEQPAETSWSSPSPQLDPDELGSGSDTPSSEAEPGGAPSYAGDASAPKLSFKTISRRQLKPKAREAVLAVGDGLNELLTKEDSIERELELFIADEKDADAIADPVAGLLSRRIPEAAGDADLADLLNLAFALAVYARKQWRKHREARKIRRQLVAQTPVDHTPPEENAA